jgi:magnesium chelatase accessory protein
MTPAPAPMSRMGWPDQTEELVAVDGIRFRVVTAGRGPTLLALHGTGSSSHSFRPLMRELGDRFRIVAPDLPGHAETRVPRERPLTLDAMAEAVAALCRVQAYEPKVVVGHSAGAAVAMRMVLDGAVRPDLLVGLASAATPLRGLSRLVFPRVARVAARSKASMLFSLWVGRRQKVRQLLESIGSDLDPAQLHAYERLAAQPRHIEGVLSMLSSWNVAPLTARLPELGTRVLLIAGQRDDAVPFVEQVRLVRALPDARLEVVPDAGHLLHEQRPDAIRDLILDEFRSVHERSVNFA